MAGKRKSLSQKTRFEVFKRDSFKCQYCGQTPPDVVLQVDHFIAVASGGSNDIDNLITSCSECNLGKGAGDVTIAPESLASRMEREQETAKQFDEYNKFLLGRKDIEDAAIRRLGSQWFDQITEKGKYTFGISRVQTVRTFLKSLPETVVSDAIDLALSRIPAHFERDENAWKYFCGICWRKIKGDGRHRK